MSHPTYKDLAKLSVDELRKEIRQQQSVVAKLKIAIALRKEKAVAQLKLERRHLARLETALTSASLAPVAAPAELKTTKKSSTLPARRSRASTR